MQDIVYKLGNSLYLNITNRCTNECSFCIRNKTKDFNSNYKLWLASEPTTEEIIKAIGDPRRYEQIVFCGYGEPLIRLETVKEVATAIKAQHGSAKIRIDTNGHANLFWGRNILPELKGLIDFISISLNAQDAYIYNKLCAPTAGEKTFDYIIDFIKEAKKHIPQVEASVVGIPEVIDIEKTKKIAEKLGVSFRIRPYYEDMYIS
ncbi:radical SAM protein [candidate division WOR-1 bacterium RIFOXYD2_FULL_36_8]|uniref:Radical SAM protein n=1 Tax=candidate division WOR-1 bacterium RIFOXYB2_FULL_36_35 TaxID=1802578 RepID=A0A1F4S2L9_UNCSA|nr:MAG: radical SAM protein [candidate division WOR-1 bacterium RIFOXYA2_FULL_36_21]OGC13983.1 MAG: radical SAM protein [candidate division WOR-1 bacterium RIFOXYB2_FULL_36_35]OGC16606.1 MAG: radical SAM protein [candidate division WOR-1 bacterium RIFOXYA12_FULL_36_13]OGC41217.1 MAG: radical SAM protein [candidate division WOR-1 bacterium RIFOXYD2_FULL_36_8]